MTRIILDAGSASKLTGLVRPAELCDPSGRVLGRFVPVIDMSDWEPVTPDVSEEELDRREQSTEWYTTEQVRAQLKGPENRPEPQLSGEELQRREQESDHSPAEGLARLKKL